MDQDTELLRRFAEEGAQDAFAELVRRRVNLVFAAALRQTGGDAHLAEDVTQKVFLALANHARSLARHAVLTGWFFTTTRYLAIRAMRQQRRWQRREQEASAMNLSNQPGPVWENLRLVIDEALHELDEKDRTALLLRYFDGRPLAEVGMAIGLAENSARMRVDRALEKLRGRLAKRGITSTAVALGALLAAQPTMAAPAGLAAAATSSALAGVAAGTTVALPWIQFMSMTKITIGAAGIAAVVGTGAYFAGISRSAAQESELAALRTENQKLSADLQRQNRPQVARAVPESATGVRPDGLRLVDQAAAVAARRAAREAAAVQKSAVERPAGTSSGPLPAASVESLRLLADLKNRSLANIDIAFVTPAGQLSPNFAELFGLTTEERATLQQSVDRVRERVAEAERANARVARGADGSVTISVGSFAQGGRGSLRRFDEIVLRCARAGSECRLSGARRSPCRGLSWVLWCGGSHGDVYRRPGQIAVQCERAAAAPRRNRVLVALLQQLRKGERLGRHGVAPASGGFREMIAGAR